MKIQQKLSFIQVIGKIWMPAVIAAYKYDLSPHDIENIVDTQRTGIHMAEAVDDWLAKNAGDFQDIVDFYANFEVGDTTVEVPWKNEESELMYNDLVYGSED